MSRLTIFTAPKPFTDAHIALIQRNAIRSWQQIPDTTILLVGEEAGLAEAATGLGIGQVKGVRRNEQGTPLVSSIFQLAREASQTELLAYVNADMLLLPDFQNIAANASARGHDVVLLGQRHDLDVNTALDFSIGWADRLRAQVQHHGRLHPMGGSDYFIFPRHLFKWIPDFAIGRAGWDNWMIFHAISQGWTAVNATHDLLVVHQNHDYAHIGEGGHRRHPETFANTELGGGMRSMYMLLDLEYELIGGQIHRARPSLARLLRALERKLQPEQLVGRGPRWWLLRGLRKLRRALLASEAS
jgi:hypothetical protein